MTRQGKRRLWWWALLPPLLFLLAELSLSPLIAAAARQRCHSLALVAVSSAVRSQAVASPASDYQNLMHIERDSQGYITLIVLDTGLVNLLISEVSLGVEEELGALSRQRLTLPLGAVTGSALLSGLGPDIGFRVAAAAAPAVAVEDGFLSAGVNQTLHSVYLHIDTEIQVLAPFSRQRVAVSHTVLLAEAVIVGYTPDTYVTLDGALSAPLW